MKMNTTLLLLSLSLLCLQSLYCFQRTQLQQSINPRSANLNQHDYLQSFQCNRKQVSKFWMPTQSTINRASQTKLYFDVFGVGPSELVVIAAAAGLIYGPDKVNKQFKEKGVQGAPTAKGWKREREERIKEMTEVARAARAKRGMNRLNRAMEDGNQYVLDKVDDFEDES